MVLQDGAAVIADDALLNVDNLLGDGDGGMGSQDQGGNAAPLHFFVPQSPDYSGVQQLPQHQQGIPKKNIKLTGKLLRT
jgi:hypothetical protein